MYKKQNYFFFSEMNAAVFYVKANRKIPFSEGLIIGIYLLLLCMSSEFINLPISKRNRHLNKKKKIIILSKNYFFTIFVAF